MSDLFEKVKKKTDPCWKGYKQLGMKTKDGKEVPNCIPESATEHEYKVGDTVWAKHPTLRYKTMAGVVKKIDSTHATLEHKDGSTGKYVHSDIANDFEKLNPNPYRKTESAYDKINDRFKKLSGKSLEDASKKYDDIQKKLADQKAKYIAQGTIKESEEQLDELSTMTLRNYRKAVDNSSDDSKRNNFQRVKSALGYSRATQKIKNNSIKASAKNESEQLVEGWVKIHPLSQEKDNKDRIGKTVKIKTTGEEGIIHRERKIPTFSKTVPYMHVVTVKLKDGSTSTHPVKHIKIVNESEQLEEISQETKDSYISKAKEQITQAEPYAKGKSDVSSFAKRLIDRRKKGLKLATEAADVNPNMDKDPATYVKKKGVSPEGEHSGRKVRRGTKGKITFNTDNNE